MAPLEAGQLNNRNAPMLPAAKVPSSRMAKARRSTSTANRCSSVCHIVPVEMCQPWARGEQEQSLGRDAAGDEGDQVDEHVERV